MNSVEVTVKSIMTSCSREILSTIVMHISGLNFREWGWRQTRGISSIVFCVSTVEGYVNHIKWLNLTRFDFYFGPQ